MLIEQKIFHVLPLDDLKFHSEVGTYCRCQPRLQPEPNGTIVIHNAYDGREFFEEDWREHPTTTTC